MTDKRIINDDIIKQIKASEEALTLTELKDIINTVLKNNEKFLIKPKYISNWLVKCKYLITVELDNRTCYSISQSGLSIGIEEKINGNGNKVLYYSSQAQQFIINNLQSVISLAFKILSTSDTKLNNKYEKWTEEDMKKLKEYCQMKYSTTRISKYLRRTVGAVKSKMLKLGISNSDSDKII